MTWGNFQRTILGYQKRRWGVSREIIAAIINGYSKKAIKGEDIFPFGLKAKAEKPNEEDKEHIKKRQADINKRRHGVIR